MPETTERRRFFVVWSPQGGPPVVRFPTFKAARSIAIKLSLKHADQDFFVLESCWKKIGKPMVEAVSVSTPEAEVLDSGPPAPDPEAVP
jgi:hypothetical protein